MLIRTLLLLLLAPMMALAQPRFDLASTQTQLPKSVLPMRVQLALDLDPSLDTFAGDVRIHLRALQAVPAIVLHAKALEADSMTIARAGMRPRALRVRADEKALTWRLEPTDGRPITAGTCTRASNGKNNIRIRQHKTNALGHKLPSLRILSRILIHTMTSPHIGLIRKNITSTTASTIPSTLNEM